MRRIGGKPLCSLDMKVWNEEKQLWIEGDASKPEASWIKGTRSLPIP
jgi:hypothetical protein